MIKEIAFTAYPAKDVAALRSWYEKMFGMKFSPPFKEGEVEKYAESNAGGGYFSLMTTEWRGEPGSGAGVAFEVEDIAKSIADLTSKGVKVEGPWDTPVCKIAALNDQEGNKIFLHQITVPH